MVSLQRARSVGLLVVLFSLLSFPMSREADATAPASPRLISAADHQAVLRLAVPEYQLAPVAAPAGTFARLEAPGAGSSGAPGAPDLPVWRAALGVPAGAEVRLRVLGGAAERIPGAFRLLPVPAPMPAAEPVDGLPAPGATAIAPDPAAYASAAAYPAAPASIARDAWLRDQRIIQIELAPFQYVAATGELSWRRELTVEVSWSGGAAGLAPAPANELAPAPGGLLLNAAQAAAWRSVPPRPAAGALAPGQPPETRYKLVVDQDGMYRVTRAELAAAGMPVDTVDPRTFRLTSQGGDIAISVTGESDGVFNAGDELRFYGQRYATRVISDTFIENGALVNRPSEMSAFYADATSYTDENVYWLTVGGAPGPRMAATDAAPISGGPVAPHYRELVHAEESYRWYSTQFLSRDKWMWGRLNLPIAGGGPATFTATASLSAVAPGGGPARVRAEIQSLLQGAGAADHSTRFALLGPGDVRTILEDATWDGISIHQLDIDAPRSALREGTNYLELTANLQPGMAADQIFFNWFEIEYDRSFQAVGNALSWPGRASGSWNYQVAGFSAADLLAFDVSDPARPRQLINGVVTPSGGGQQIALGLAGAADRRYLAVSAAAMRAPKRLSAYTPPDLRAASNGADYIFITHANFLTATQALAAYRAGQGMRTIVVDVEDVYNEFNDGIFHPVAIKRFLAYAYATWQGAPVSYALLVGDGHWNLKNFAPPPAGPLPPGQPPYTDYRAGPVYMPPLLAWVDPYQGEVDSTNLLAAFVGEDIFPDVSIGRLPVNTAAQAQAAVAKTIAFEQAPAAGWQRRMLFVADNTPDPAGDFVELSEQIIEDHLPAGWAADRIYLDEICGPPSNQLPSCPAMNQRIISTLNTTGTLFLNYTGHASLNRWAAEQIFVNANVSALANGDKLPIVLSMTCLDGYWLYPNLPGMMEEMVRADSRGAVAAFSPTGLGVASGHDIMQRGFYDAIFNDGMRRLGPATIAGKAELAVDGFHDDLINTFAILGDPALRLPLPPPALRLYLPLVSR